MFFKYGANHIPTRNNTYLFPLIEVLRGFLVCLLTLVLFCQFESSLAQTPEYPYIVEVVVTSAKLRTGPGSGYPSNGIVTEGTQLLVYESTPLGDWFLVDRDKGLWIAAVQVKVFSAGGESFQTDNTPSVTPGGTADTENESNQQVPPMPEVGIQNKDDQQTRVIWQQIYSYIQQAFEKLITKYQQILQIDIENSPEYALLVPMGGISLLFVLAWFVILAIPLLFGFQFKWCWGSLVFSLSLGPLGLLLSIIIALLSITHSDKIKNSSPRDLLEEIVTSPAMIAIFVILFILLTAVSILGGVIFFAALFLYYQLIRFLVPGSSRQSTLNNTYEPAGGSLTSGGNSSSSSSDSDNGSYDNSFDNSYDNQYDYHNDDDNNDDDEKGSIWDGWLIKY